MDTSHLIEVRELNLRLYQEAIKIFQVGDKRIIIKHDDCPEDPLSWGHFEFFSTSKRHYTDKKHKTIRAKNGDLASISQYFNGDIYRYAIINSDDELEDSLCGIYGLDGIREVLKDQQGIEIPKI